MPLIDKGYCESLLAAQKIPEPQASVSRDDFSTKAFAKIVQLIGVRDRSVSELRDRLLNQNFTESVIEDALAKAVECGLCDDIRFGENLIVSRKNANKGKSGIERELEKHAIEPQSIPGWPEEYFPNEESEIEAALAFLEKKPPRAKHKREAAYRKLIARGYSSSIASRAARLWFENLS